MGDVVAESFVMSFCTTLEPDDPVFGPLCQLAYFGIVVSVYNKVRMVLVDPMPLTAVGESLDQTLAVLACDYD